MDYSQFFFWTLRDPFSVIPSEIVVAKILDAGFPIKMGCEVTTRCEESKLPIKMNRVCLEFPNLHQVEKPFRRVPDRPIFVQIIQIAEISTIHIRNCVHVFQSVTSNEIPEEVIGMIRNVKLAPQDI